MSPPAIVAAVAVFVGIAAGLFYLLNTEPTNNNYYSNSHNANNNYSYPYNDFSGQSGNSNSNGSNPVKKRRKDKDKVCAICLEELELLIRTVPNVDLLCSHTYHEQCLNKWMMGNSKPTCPTCRREIQRR